LRQAIGRFKGGLTTKILALTDALGNLVRIVLLPGQRFDTVGVPPLIDGVTFGALIGDTAFDSNDIVADLNERGAKVVIAQHPRRTRPLAIDTEMYKWRHLIENFLCKLKEFKRIGGTVVADHASGEGGEDWREGDRSRYTVFQMAEVVVPRDLFRRILGLIDELRPRQVTRCRACRRRRSPWGLTGEVRPKCRLMGTRGAVGRVRPAIGASSGGEPASWGCSEMVGRAILPWKHASGLSIWGMSVLDQDAAGVGALHMPTAHATPPALALFGRKTPARDGF